MKGYGMAVVAGTALTFSLCGQAAAQDAGARRGSRMTAEPERIMALRERLELTEDQLTALEELRMEGVQRRAEARARMDEVRSRLRAGEIERNEMRAMVQELRDTRPDADDRRARIEGILTEDQLQSLRDVRDRGFRGRRGAFRGSRGQIRGGRGTVRGPRAGVRGGRARVRMKRDAVRGRTGPVRLRGRAARAWRTDVMRQSAATRARGR